MAALVLGALTVLVPLAFTTCQQLDVAEEAAGGTLTLRGVRTGAVYQADIYAYSGRVTNTASWAAATAVSRKTAEGFASAADGKADIPLRTASGAAFTRSGTLLAVISYEEADGQASVRYRSAVFTAGGATLSLSGLSDPAELLDPSAPVLSPGLHIDGTNAGSLYTAELFAYSASGIKDAASWAAATAASAKAARGAAATAESLTLTVPLKASDGSGDFSGSGRFLVAVTETDAARQMTVRYTNGASFVSGGAAADWTAMTDAPLAPASDGGIVRISGTADGKTYAADLYAYTGTGAGGSGILSLDEYGAYTAPVQRIASGSSAAEAETAEAADSVPLPVPLKKTAGAAAFDTAGSFLVTVTEYTGPLAGETRYQAAAAFDGDGSADIDWQAMRLSPSGQGEASGALSLTGASGGKYRAEVFGYSGTGELSFEDYSAHTASSQRAAAGEGPPALIPLATDGGADFKASGVCLVTASEYDTDGTAGETRYLTGVRFTGGSASVDWQAMLPPPADTTVRYVSVSFETDGGSAVPAQEVEVGGKAERPDPDPTKPGGAFAGWFTTPALTKTFDFNAPVNADTIVYAAWKEVYYYTVSFDTDGGTAVSSQRILPGGTAKQPDSVPTKSGHRFEGWFTTPAFTAPFDFDNTDIVADIKVYAKWQQVYKVSFVMNGGSPQTPEQTLLPGEKASEPDAVPSKTGCHFDGWFATAALDTVFNFTAAISANTTIYAKWSDIYCTLSFDTDGGSAVDPIIVKYGSPAAEPWAVPTDSTRLFAGWYADARSTPFDFSQKLYTDITAYARWTATFGVTFDTQGGSPQPATQRVPAGGTTAPVAAPARGDVLDSGGRPTTRYTFDGWWTQANGGGTLFVPGTTVVNADITVYAKWISAYVVIFDQGITGSSTVTGLPASASVAPGSAVPRPSSEPLRSGGYSFYCWSKTRLDEAFYASAIPFAFADTASPELLNGPLTLYAVWERIVQ